MNGDECSWTMRHIDNHDTDENKGVKYVINDDGLSVLTSVTGPKSEYYTLGEDINEILRIVSWIDDAGNAVYHFYRLDRLELEWIRLEEWEWMDRIWFFRGYYVVSTAAIGGAKMFTKSVAPSEKDRVKLICHDLLRKSRHVLVGDFISGSSWVCLGQ